VNYLAHIESTLDREANLVNNKLMKQFSKHIALFLTLVVLSNGLFAAQMTVSMIEDATKIESLEGQLPCHGEDADNTAEAMDCCKGDCTGCVLSTTVTSSSAAGLPKPLQAEKLAYISNHLLPAHSSNLYRPPIQI
jgi:hypothetical protein